MELADSKLKETDFVLARPTCLSHTCRWVSLVFVYNVHIVVRYSNSSLVLCTVYTELCMVTSDKVRFDNVCLLRVFPMVETAKRCI